MASSYLPLFYDDWASVIEEYDDSSVGALVRALMNHANGKAVGNLQPGVKVLFAIMSGSVDRYTARCKRNAANGKKGGAPRGNRNAAKVTKTSENNQIQTKTTEKQPKLNRKTSENKPHTIPLPYHSISSNEEIMVDGYGMDHPADDRRLDLAQQVPELYQAQNNFSYTEAETMRVLQYFFDAYAVKQGQPHPHIPTKKLAKLIAALSEIEDVHGQTIDIAPECYSELIDGYFATEMHCNYQLSHFMSGSIRQKRYYENFV